VRRTNDNKQFNFDILMANPPFAGDIKEGQILSLYELANNAKGKRQSKVGRDILFIERNLDFLKPGGRMAIVLPQGRFNNSSDAHIRKWLAEHGRILAVVGLHGNVFKPHTGTKTSVLFLQKWTDDNGINPRRDDYPIFFATMQKPSKDNSGEKIYLKDENGKLRHDEHGHLIVDHDLFNHEGLTQDGIFEAFAEFAKKEKLSFFLSSESAFDQQRYQALLEELEVSEVWLSKVMSEQRIDSEYFKDEYNKIIKKIMKSTSNKKLVCDYFQLNSNIIKPNKDEEYFYIDISGIDISSGEMNAEKICGHNLPSRAKYILEKGNLLVSTVRPNRDAIAIANESSLIASSGFAVLNKKGEISSEVLFAFLKTSHAISLLSKNAAGASYPAVTNNDVLNLPLPPLSKELQNKLTAFINKSKELRENSKSPYNQAQSLLLSELELN